MRAGASCSRGRIRSKGTGLQRGPVCRQGAGFGGVGFGWRRLRGRRLRGRRLRVGRVPLRGEHGPAKQPSMADSPSAHVLVRCPCSPRRVPLPQVRRSRLRQVPRPPAQASRWEEAQVNRRETEVGRAAPLPSNAHLPAGGQLQTCFSSTLPALSRSGALPGWIITVNPWPRRAVRATVRRLLLLATEARRRWCRSRMAGGVRRVGHGWPTPPLPAMDGWRRGGALPPPAGSCGAPSGPTSPQAKSCVRSDSSSIRHSPSGRSPSDRPPTWLRCRASTWLPTAANMRRTWW